jgi:hypothetical protein
MSALTSPRSFSRNFGATSTSVLALSSQWLGGQTGEVNTTLQSQVSREVSPRQFGGKADAVILPNAGSVNGTALTVTGATFTQADVGKTIVVCECGPTLAALFTTIAALPGGNNVTLAKAPTITASGLTGRYMHNFVGTTRTAVLSTTAGSTTLVDSSAPPGTAAIGDEIVIHGCVRGRLSTTIAAVISSTQVTLADAASVVGSGVTVYYGTDNVAAVKAAVAVCNTLGFSLVFDRLPTGETGDWLMRTQGATLLNGTVINPVRCSILRTSGARILTECDFAALTGLFWVDQGDNLDFDINQYDPAYLTQPNSASSGVAAQGCISLYMGPFTNPIRNARVKIKGIGCGAGLYIYGGSGVNSRVECLDYNVHTEWSSYGVVIHHGYSIKGKQYAKRFERCLFINGFLKVAGLDINVTAEQAWSADGFDSIDVDIPASLVTPTTSLDLDNIKIAATWIDASCLSPFAIRTLTDFSACHRNIHLILAVPNGVTRPSLTFRLQTAAGVTTSSGTPSLCYLDNFKAEGFSGLGMFGYYAKPQLVKMSSEDIALGRRTFSGTTGDAWGESNLFLQDEDGYIVRWVSSTGFGTRNTAGWKFPVFTPYSFAGMCDLFLYFQGFSGNSSGGQLFAIQHYRPKPARSGAGNPGINTATPAVLTGDQELAATVTCSVSCAYGTDMVLTVTPTVANVPNDSSNQSYMKLKGGGGSKIPSGPQLWVASRTYVLNDLVYVGSWFSGNNYYKCTTAGSAAASGGPTGTGTGITDNTAVWAFVGTIP